MRSFRAVSPCENCGASEWRYPSLVSKLRYWLFFGGPWGAGPRTCQRCGHVNRYGGGYSSAALTRNARITQPARALLAPVWLVVALRDNRRMRPVPWVFVAAAALGVPIGIALRATLNWPWWIGPPLALALAWLAFLSSARTNLRNATAEFLRLTTPRYARQLQERRHERELRFPPFPLYGLGPSWVGIRFVGGRGSDGRSVTSIELAHGDPFDDHAPAVRIESAVRSEIPLEYRKHGAITAS